MASFSSSLKGLFVVQGFRVAGWLRGLRDGAKSTIRPRRGQAPQRGAARRAAGRHHDRIDRIDRVTLLRPEAREAERCRLGRVGRASSLSKGRGRGRLPPDGGRFDDRTKGPQDERSRPRRLRLPGPSEARNDGPRHVRVAGSSRKRVRLWFRGSGWRGGSVGCVCDGEFWRIPAQKGSQGECRFVVPSSESAADRRSCNCGSGGSPRS